MSIMKAIYDGRVYPAEQITSKIMEDNSEYSNLVGALADRMDEYKESEDKDVYAKIDGIANLMTDIHAIEIVESFKYGMSLGLRLMQEAERIPDLESELPNRKLEKDDRNESIYL